MRVLLAGSLPATTTSLTAALRDARATVLRCAPDEAVATARIDDVDVVLLDPTAARGEPWRAVGALRRAGLDVGIVLLADADPAIDTLERWMDEADDCLLGLLNAREVVAHCRAVDRRRRGHPAARLEVRGISVDSRNGDVFVGERAVRVPPQARRVLRTLLVHADALVTKDRLIAAVWDGDEPLSARKIVELLVHQLRYALTSAGAPEGLIENLRGEGYMVRRAAGPGDAVAFTPSKAKARSPAPAGAEPQVRA